MTETVHDSPDAGVSSAADPVRPNKRERILEAALELFTERGFHGTAMPLVAERAGVGAGTIYRYFESKEALVNVLFQKWHLRLDEFVFADFPETAPVRMQFHHWWTRVAEFSRKYPTATTFLSLHFHSPYLDAKSRASAEAMWDRGFTNLRTAQEQQVVKPLPVALLMFMLDGMITGMFRARQSGMVELDEALIRSAEECAWAAVRR